MPRIDRSRFRDVRFPIVEDIATRFDDVDLQGHINNAAAIILLQEARARLNRMVDLRRHIDKPIRAMVVGVSVEYAAELFYPDPVTIMTGVLALGRTSIIMGQIARQRGRDAIYAEVAMVVANEVGPVPLPSALRSAYAALEIVPAGTE